MFRLICVLILTIVLSQSALRATDFVAKKLEVTLLTANAYQLMLLVRNDNVLADQFSVKFEVFLGSDATGTKVYTNTQSETTLAPFTEREVTSTQPFIAETPGSHFARAEVVYGSEIDPGDNITTLIFEALIPSCSGSESWVPGPAMQVVQSFKIWPDTPMVGGKLRPADVIGISVNVTDLDMLLQTCSCADQDTMELRGPYPDLVSYEWSLDGPGTLVVAPSSARNQIMYQLPVCPPSERYNATVNLRVTNAGGKAADEQIVGSVTFSVNTNRIYSADFTPTWDAATYDVVPSYQHLQPKSDGVTELTKQKACIPKPPAWEKDAGIAVQGGMLKSHAEHLCPEYLTILSVKASDADKYTMMCEATPNSCPTNDTVKNVSNDVLTYTWSIIGGAGAIPLPSNGASVAIRRSATKQTIVQCVIDDGALQANDDPVTIVDTLPPVGKPKAFVGLGDDEGTSVSKIAGGVWDYWAEKLGASTSTEDTYGGRSGGLHEAFESLVTRLTDAGYDVVSDDSLLVGTFDAMVTNPCYKVFAFVGHGSGGHINMARMQLGGWNTPSRNASHVSNFTQTAFNCAKHPFWRDLVLLACETMKGSWGTIQSYGRAHGYSETKTFAALRLWAYWSYKPYPPIILTVE